MAQPRHAWTIETDTALHSIFKRCVQCESQTPTCPDCLSGQICSLVPQSCSSCQYMTCIANPSAPAASSGPNVGAVAGGVVGSLVFAGLAIFLLWRFWRKQRRAQQALVAEDWQRDDIAQQKGENHFNTMRSDAASTRTRASFANSFLSRASNIIQIAYIPGVTNRNGTVRDSLAPVPPIPAAYANHTPKSLLSNANDALFFSPGDLRGSTYSGTSTLRSSLRDTQYSRRSITPSLARSSVVSSVYRDNASVEPMPATTVVRAAARMVSVKAPSPRESAGQQTLSNTPTSQLSRANTNESYARAKQVVVSKNKTRFPIRQPNDSHLQPMAAYGSATPSPLAETFISLDDDDDDEHWRARQSLGNSSTSPSTAVPENPFLEGSPTTRGAYSAISANVGTSTDPRSRPFGRRPGSLSAVTEEVALPEGRVGQSDRVNDAKFASPFSDVHLID